jgi:hypothetical protein
MGLIAHCRHHCFGTFVDERIAYQVVMLLVRLLRSLKTTAIEPVHTPGTDFAYQTVTVSKALLSMDVLRVIFGIVRQGVLKAAD